MLDLAFRDATSKDGRLRSVARATIPLLLTGWHSGVYSSSQAYSSYVDGREAALRVPE
ncbi:hypothetical protein [Microbacterium aurantiacum]|uniref:hypothetical protein n=1 Tax=Microbacterium aurantiacum TaxID=162393 RepID=UPI0015E0816D|nr:hypothetical protein [Microbacterium aurantiacum]